MLISAISLTVIADNVPVPIIHTTSDTIVTDSIIVSVLSRDVMALSDDGDDDGWSLLKVVVPTTPAAT